MKEKLNLFAQVQEHESDVQSKLVEVAGGKRPSEIETPNGAFDNEAWLDAELKAATEEKERIIGVVTVEDAFGEDGQ